MTPEADIPVLISLELIQLVKQNSASRFFDYFTVVGLTPILPTVFFVSGKVERSIVQKLGDIAPQAIGGLAVEFHQRRPYRAPCSVV